jgi:hypothetical protein
MPKSAGWRLPSKLKVRQWMKSKTSQPYPFPGTIFNPDQLYGFNAWELHQHHVYDVTMKNYPVGLLNFTIQESKKAYA